MRYISEEFRLYRELVENMFYADARSKTFKDEVSIVRGIVKENFNFPKLLLDQWIEESLKVTV